MTQPYRQNPIAANRRAVMGGEIVAPRDWPPMLPGEESRPMQTVPVLDQLVLEGQVLFVRWREINATAAGNNTILTAVGGRKLTVVSLEFVCSAAVTISWLSDATTLRNAQAFAANSGIARDVVRPYYVQTNPGENLIMNLSGAVNVRGSLGYVEVGS